jgi:hypothetical protein
MIPPLPVILTPLVLAVPFSYAVLGENLVLAGATQNSGQVRPRPLGQRADGIVDVRAGGAGTRGWPSGRGDLPVAMSVKICRDCRTCQVQP